MDLITENTNQTGTYVLENQWSIKELQLLINRLSDNRGGDGRKRSERNISRENFLAVPAPPSSSTPRHDKSQSRCHKRGRPVMNKTADGIKVEYIPYEERSAPELICWWKRRIIEGKNLGEATQNYLLLRLRSKYVDMIEDKDVFEARRIINNMIDQGDVDERERQERAKK
nr:glutamic acid-rich protein-like [Ipomoea batatas]